MTNSDVKNEKIINLAEVPEDGKDYIYTRESGELNLELDPLLQGQNYELKFNLRPAGNAYEMIGEIKTSLPLLCSRCAIDLDYKINEKFHEILLVSEPMGRGHKSGSTNHMSDGFENGPFCNYLEKEELDVAMFTHELVALAEPAAPLGNDNCMKSCENYDNAVKNNWVTPLDQAPIGGAFDALKDLKVKDPSLNDKN